ncbi:hypothetical protein KC319_g11 [Hortaea werneckii]|nr:hypothetical protein KC319_g11 [Hortaea werneckii]
MAVLGAIKPELLEVCWCSCRPIPWRLCWAGGFCGSSNVRGTVSWRMEPVRARYKQSKVNANVTARLALCQHASGWLQQAIARFRFVQSSMNQFVEAAREVLVEVPAGHSLELLNQVLVHVQEDIQVVTNQIDSSTAAEGKLGNKQFRLRRREQKFAAAVQETLRILSDNADSPSSVHPLLEKHYAGVADLEVLQERLEGLEAEFEEEKINRQLRQHQGQSPEHSDEEFEAAYIKKIQDARSALTDAENRLAYLEKECVQEGFRDFGL